MTNDTIKNTNLFLGPHPDDVFISCAGYIIKNLSKNKPHILCMTSSGLSPNSMTRIDEETRAWHSLGAPDLVLDFFEEGQDTRLHESYNRLVEFIENRVNSIAYKYVFVPWPRDTHQDHRTVTSAALSACRYFQNIIFYETPSSIDFTPSIFVKLDDDIMKTKRLMALKYSSQILGNNSFSIELKDIVESKAISNGVRSRTCKYAEGYSPFRLFI